MIYVIPAWMREKTRTVPLFVWGPLSAGFLILIVGWLGVISGQSWLFPSLGPTAFLQAEKPESPSSSIYSTIVGHLVGMAVAFLLVLLFGAADSPSVLTTGHLTEARLWASVLGLMISLLLMMMLRASHPPSAATTLLITLGGFGVNMKDAITIIGGVLILAVTGEFFRQLRQRTL